MTRSFGWVVVLYILGLTGCRSGEQDPPLFELLPPERTGITFVNEVTETPELSILNYLNFYNGGGVAAGDVDGDGRPDLFFTSNLGPDRLYRNLGDFRFEDITQQAGVGGARGWKTGVTMADVDGDGHLDIYVSTVSHLALQGGNVLYVNNGDGTFTDRTREFGLTHRGYSTQAAFFDYDSDGDLDMYLLNHSTHEERAGAGRLDRTVRHPRSGDRLFRNEGNRFVDVSETAGIYGGVEGYGLGVVVSDVNLDGCPDLLVANDFHEGDFLYHNDCHGTFTEGSERALGHSSHSSMGVDAADFTNDGRPDLVVLDMLPEREDILKTSANAEDLTMIQRKLEEGYQLQYARNTLHVNRGAGRFSEIGYLAGVFATDWSWAPLFADLDNDGHKDLFVTNGIYRRPNDLDYVSYVADRTVQSALAQGMSEGLLSTVLDQMPHVPLPNYAYRNNGDLTFTNVAESWGLAQPGFSTGAAYVDLNDDGALDLVVNNINAAAGIYRNHSREITGHHYLAVQLMGVGANTAGIGARVAVTHDGTTQWLEQMPTRGFQSSVDLRLHFGLGPSPLVDSVIVVWPDQRFEIVRDVAVDQTLTLSQQDASGQFIFPREEDPAGQFVDVTRAVGVDVKHEENTFFDYTREPLIPHQLSTEGPALAVGDVDGNDLDDIFLGGGKWQAGQLLIQQTDGTFRARPMRGFQEDSLHEDVDAILFDADGDGDLDLYVVSGGNEFWGEQEPLRDRLYVNDGRGYFRRDRDALPAFYENGSSVAAGDFDGDGDVDLFVGGRVTSRRYGDTPRSYLLRNDGAGRFEDVTVEHASGLTDVGMVTSAVWTDYDGDGQLDLIVVGEWMPIRVFRQEAKRLVDRTAEAGLAETNGWWNVVVAVDLRGNGRPDLVVGNLGLNSYLRASPQEPARLYVHDFDGNGAREQILTFYKGGVSYPMAGRDELARVLPRLLDRYPTYADFGDRRIEDLFAAPVLDQAAIRTAYRYDHAVALNNGDGSFAVRSLPTEAQFAPIYAVAPGDFDADGHNDIVMGGNFYGVPPVRGRYDASYGLFMRGDGTGGLLTVEMTASQLVIDGQVRAVKSLRHAGGGRLLVVARNDDTLQLYRTPAAGQLGGSTIAP